MFTAGVRTTGRVESENSVNKVFGGPKVSLHQLFTALNDRTEEQHKHSQIRARDSSRRQHETQLEGLFHSILDILRDVVGPFALNKCYDQMAKSLFYDAGLVQLPDGATSWTQYSIRAQNEIGFVGEGTEESCTGMFNTFENDSAYMSTRWLLRQLRDRGLVPIYLVRVTHKTSGTVHIIAIFPDGRYLCDCCMGSNLGIVCCHFFLAWTKMDGLPFHVSSIRARWYQDPAKDVADSPTVTFQGKQARNIKFTAQSLPNASVSNLFSSRSDARPPTQTIPQREVYHRVQAEIAPLMNEIQTEEQMQRLQESLAQIQRDSNEEQRREEIQDPRIVSAKGRPRTQRLTGSTEGQARGGGAGIRTHRPQYQAATSSTRAKEASKHQNNCSLCRQPGHNRTTCSLR
ncbi:hypothetical protein DFH06DRAFT_1070481 [Mycena polygramma]|nr:hypothetical protein DFH06DRAFT_1070481 [Mycena polygramma]